MSSTCSEQPPTEALNGASSARERGDKEEEEEKPKEDEQGQPDLTPESTGPGTGGPEESPVLADSNPAEPKVAEEVPASSVVLENGEASDSENAGTDGSSTHVKVSWYHISWFFDWQQ